MIEKQMELFRDGGLKDEGGMIDEESGNEVPIGGTKEGVRDDIPANVSEGEFVMPADVVRYHGLDKMMQIRQEAKMGLKKMEAMGQMGNSDEATMDDDMPFGMADLIVVGDNDEPMEFADGGFVPVKNYAPGGLTTGATGSGRVGQPVDVEPTAPVIPVDQPSTRRLTPEAATAPVTKIDFKKLMGEAAIEYKEYRNAAGESMMISFIGGQPAYPIPDGYSLYTGDGAVGSGTAGGTADGIAYAANTATAEYRQSNNDNDDPLKDMPVAKAIDWASLSTEELMAESAKLTGVSSTIAKGAMAFMGPFGAIGYAMMRHQDKKVAQEIANRIAKGGLTAAQLKTLTAAQEKLTPKGFTLIGKIIETVGNALGFGKDAVEATKKNAVSIENKTTSRSPALSGDRLIATMKEEIRLDEQTNAALATTEAGREGVIGNIGDVIPTSTANMARDFAKDGTDFANRQDKIAQRYREMIAAGPGPLPFGQTREDIIASTIDELGMDGFRELESNLRSDYMRRNEVGNLDSTGEIVAGSGILGSTAEEKYGLSAPGSKLTSEESIAKRKDAASTYTPPSYDPIVRTPTPGLTDDDMGLPTSAVPAPTAPVDVQTENAFTPSTPSYDMFGKPYSNASTRAVVDRALESSSSSANVMTEIDRLLKTGTFGTDLGPLPGVDPNFTLESANMIKAESSPDVVPPSPVLNIDNRPSGDIRDYQGGSYGYGQTGVAPVATAPVAAAPVTSYQAPEGSASSGIAPPADPRDVGTQTQQAFNFNAEDAAMSMPVGSDPYDYPTSNQIANRQAADLYKANQAANAIATAKDPRNLGGSEGYGPTPTAQTFKQAFATNRAAGAKTFDYNGKSYTTQTAEEAAPKGSNSLFQSAANLFTPGDGKEYIDGRLVDSGSSKSKTKTTTAASKNVATANVINKTSAPIAKTNQARFGDAGAGNVWAVQPGTNAVTKVKATKVVGARSKEAVQADINKEIANGWTPRANELVKERAAAQPAPTPVASSSNKDSGNDGGNKDKIVCTEMYRQTQLVDWQRSIKIWDIYQKRHLTPLHQVGYHWLFKPYVRGMKNSSILTKLGAALAKHRTQHLRHVLTKGKAKDDILGNIWCKIVHPLVYVAGVIKEKIGK